MAKTLPISEVKTRLPALVTGVEEREEEVIVTRKGRPAAVLVNYAEYERLKSTLETLSDPELMGQIVRSRAFFSSRRRGETLEAVFDDTPRVRARRRPR